MKADCAVLYMGSLLEMELPHTVRDVKLGMPVFYQLCVCNRINIFDDLYT